MVVQRPGEAELCWLDNIYPAVHRVLTHPSYAGAYVQGRTRRERYVDDEGRVRNRARGAGSLRVVGAYHGPPHSGIVTKTVELALRRRAGCCTIV